MLNTPLTTIPVHVPKQKKIDVVQIDCAVMKWNDRKMCLQETLRFWDYLRIQFRLLNLGEGVKWICGFVNIISFRRHCYNLGDPFHLEGLLTLGFCYSHFGLLGSTEHLFPGEVPVALLSTYPIVLPCTKLQHFFTSFER